MIRSIDELKKQLQYLEIAAGNIKLMQDKYANSQDAIAYVGSGQVEVGEALSDVYNYISRFIGLSDLDFHMNKIFGADKNGDIGIVSEFINNLQSVLWTAGEKVLDIAHRSRGLPDRRVLDTCSLRLKFARQGSLHLGFSFVSPEALFIDSHTRDNTIEYINEVIDNLNNERRVYFIPSRVSLRMLNRIKKFTRIIGKKFESSTVKYLSTTNIEMYVNDKTHSLAQDVMQGYLRSEIITLKGRLGILNFFTDLIIVKTDYGKVKMYYDQETITQEQVASAANREVEIHGTAFYSPNGVIVDFTPDHLEISPE